MNWRNNCEQTFGFPPINEMSIDDLLNGKELDYITAILLLMGKLKVDNVGVFRSTPVITVTLLGTFAKDKKDDTPNEFLDFLIQNGDMTVDQVFEAFRQQQQGRL